MSSQKPRRPNLIIPRKTTRAVRRELYIIRRIRIDKIFRLDLESFDIFITKLPLAEDRRIISEVGRVVNRFISPEWNVEIAAFIETTKTIEAGAVQVVEQLRSFLTLRFAVSYQLIKPLAMSIEKLLVVAHRHPHLEPTLHVTIEIDQMRIDRKS